MRINRVSFLGVRTDEFVAMTAFVRDVLGLQAGHRDDGWAVFELGSGDRDLVEVYRPGRYDERLLPAAVTGPTVAFAVDDLLAARAELLAADIEIVADIVWAAQLRLLRKAHRGPGQHRCLRRREDRARCRSASAVRRRSQAVERPPAHDDESQRPARSIRQ